MKVWQPGGAPHATARRAGDRRLVVGAHRAAGLDARVGSRSRTGCARRSRSSPSSQRPLTALAPALLAKFAIDDGILEQDLHALTWIVVAFIIAGVANLLTAAAQTYFTGWVGERILADLRNKLFRHLQRLSLGYYERNRAGVIISRLTNDVEALDQLVTDGVTTLVQNTLMLIGTAIILFFLDWRLALATLSVMPLMAIATAIFRVRSSRAYRAVRERLGLVTATLAEDIGGIRVVQAVRARAAQRAAASARSTRTTARRTSRRSSSTASTSRSSTSSSPLATAIVARLRRLPRLRRLDRRSGRSSRSSLYLSNFFDPVQQLSQLYNTFLAAVAALDKIMDVIDEEPEILDEPDALDLARIDGDVRFDDVRFGYGNRPEVLHGIDLDVPAGTTVALVGHTGAGKSTIAKLLARFYDPREGGSRSTAPTFAT